MMNRKAILSCCLLALSLSACALHSAAPRVHRDCAKVRHEKQFIDQAIAILEVRAHQGHVVVRAGDTPACQVDAGVVAADPAEAQRLAEGVDLQVRRAGAGVLRLCLEPGPGLRLDDLHGCWEIQAPKNVWVRVVSIDADVTVRGNVGTVEILTDNGRVTASSGGGAVLCRARSGNLKDSVEMLAAEGEAGELRVFSR